MMELQAIKRMMTLSNQGHSTNLMAHRLKVSSISNWFRDLLQYLDLRRSNSSISLCSLIIESFIYSKSEWPHEPWPSSSLWELAYSSSSLTTWIWFCLIHFFFFDPSWLSTYSVMIELSSGQFRTLHSWF